MTMRISPAILAAEFARLGRDVAAGATVAVAGPAVFKGCGVNSYPADVDAIRGRTPGTLRQSA